MSIMSGQAGPKEELQRHKQPAPFRNRRDSWSRMSIGTFLAFFPKRRSTSFESFDSRMAIRDPKTAGTAESLVMAYAKTQSFQNGSDVLETEVEKGP